jgi:hypothetical protein
LIASRVSRLFAPPLYESLAQRYMAPLPQPMPAPTPEVPEVPEPATEPVDGEPPAEDGADTPRQ